MQMNLDSNSDLPVYEQLKTQLKQAIYNHDFPSGKLPCIRTLAQMAKVSLKTMNRAVDGLVHDQICISRPRLGIYVNPQLHAPQAKHILYLGSQFYQTVNMEYGTKLLGLYNHVLYPDCQIDLRFYNLSLTEPKQFDYVLRELKPQPIDCLLVCMDLPRTAVDQLASLPFPVFFIGDFTFGELPDDSINQIREDTAERGEHLVQITQSFGKNDLLVITQEEKKNYYVKLLRYGAIREAQRHGLRIRFLSAQDMPELPDLNNPHPLSAALMSMQDNPPDAVILDGYYDLANMWAETLQTLWQQHEDILFVSTGNCIRKGVLIQPDYSNFRRKAAEIVTASLDGSSSFSGKHTLHDLITYKILKVMA